MRRTWVLVLAIACSKSKPKEEPAPPAPAVAAAPADASVPGDAAPAAGDAGIADVACTTAAIKEARKVADAHLKAGAVDKAIAQLDAIGCGIDQDQPVDLNEQVAWTRSDLSFALYKAGKHEECFSRAAGQLEPYVGNVAEVFDESNKVVRALNYNADLCRKAVEKKRGAFATAETCADGKGTTIGDAGCLVIGEGGTDENEEPTCGDVFLVAKGKRTKLTIEGEDSNLVDPSVCCNLGEEGELGITVQKRAAGWALLVVTGGRNCMGGTASTVEEHVYELRGDKLVLVHQLDVAHH